MKPTLNVPGVDPARIVCKEGDNGFQTVRLISEGHSHTIARCSPDGSAMFDGEWGETVLPDALKVMNAAIDHWRATGRLFPEPPPEPVECVCGGDVYVSPSGSCVCRESKCNLAANNVTEWNTIQAALKDAKK